MTDPKEPKAKPVRYMDFVSHKPKANADPLASRPASRPVAKPKPVERVHSVADQIPPKGAQKPVHHPERAPKIETSTVPVKKREEKPYISRTPATSRDLYAAAIDPNAKKAPNVRNDDLALKASVALSGGAKSASVKSPDNNAYSLGGKSPFLPNYTINKRPLSNSVPSKKQDNYEKLSFLGVSEEPTSHKNIYDKAEPASEKLDKKSKKPKTVKVVDDTKKKRGVPTWLVIIITIILGAAVGAGVYFLLPK